MKNLKPLLTRSGKITIGAIDHRGSLEKILSQEEMVSWKKTMIGLYKNEVSGILIDPIYGKELVDTTMNCGWMMSMEKSGYRGGQEARETELLPGWSVRQAKELGVSGVKLLLYYDSKNKELAYKQRELAANLASECEREEIIFLLEPLSYIEGEKSKEVVAAVRELRDIPMDVLKVEYPGNRESCEEISRLSRAPWVLLSAGRVNFEQYKESLKIACESGASGMAVGRAVWQEFGEYEGQEREEFLRVMAVERMRELVDIVEKYGKSVE